jgi:hypothetical protein
MQMSQTCPSCGYQNPDTARFCTRCGASLRDSGVQQTKGYVPIQPQVQGYPSPPPPTTQPSPQPTAYTQADINGFKKLRDYALLGLVGIALSGASLFFSGLRRLVLTSPTLPQNQHPPFMLNPFAMGAIIGAFIIAVAGLVIAILAFIFLYQGFVFISQVDDSLKTPARLLLLLPIGLFILIVGLGLIVGPITMTPSQSASTPYLGLVISGALLIVVSLVLSLVGVIGGEILGLWRVGTRYGESLIQIGGILLIIPLLNIFAPILVYIGSSSALAKVNTKASNTYQSPSPSTP